jgi:hypothetical protein
MPMSTTPRPQLDAAVAQFRLNPADGGAPVEVDDIVHRGPAVLAMVDGGKTDDTRASMLRELGRRISESAPSARLVVVSHGDSALGRQLSVVRIAEWMTDPSGDAARALGVLSARKLRRDRRADQPDQWVPASFVWSRLVRLGGADPAPVQHTPDPGAPGEAELDALVREVGRRLGLSPNELTQLATACRFRDLGMQVVPDEIITKIGPLTDDEWPIVQQHPERSAEMLGPSPLFADVREIVRASHEHWDGGGYPHGRRGEEIPLGARILLAAEAYLAIRGAGSYHDPARPADPIAELRAEAGARYDAQVVEALAEAVAAAPVAPAATA